MNSKTSDSNNQKILNDSRPIGLFDSGIGGITVLRELIQQFSNENFVYLGDTARLPYGSKSAETVRNYSVQNMKFLISQDVKAIVVACNTASTQIFETAYQNIPVYNVIDPGSELAITKTKSKKIAILATRATIKAESYLKKIKNLNQEIEVFSEPCPLFVPLAEEGLFEHPITDMVIDNYLKNLKNKNIDTVVLGCTHYPLLKKSILNYFQINQPETPVELIDSGIAVAIKMNQDFQIRRILPSSSNQNTEHQSLKILLTDKSEHFEKLSTDLLKKVTDIKIQYETVSVV